MLNNLVVLEGRLTRDPAELRATSNGTPVTDIAIAVRTRNKPDGTEGAPVYVDIDVYGPRANTIVSYLKKGDQIFVQGELRRVKRTRADGTEYNELRVALTDFSFGAKARVNQATGVSADPTVAAPAQPVAMPQTPAPAFNPAQNTQPAQAFSNQSQYQNPAPAVAPHNNYGPGSPGYVPQPEDISMGDIFAPNKPNNTPTNNNNGGLSQYY